MTEIKTFNPGKRYSEDVLLYLIKSHSTAGLVVSFGAPSIEEAKQYSSGQRIVNRFNGLKERCCLQISLVNEINGTVEISGSKEEKIILSLILENLNNLKENIEEKKDELLDFEIVHGIKKPYLTKKFNEVNKYLDELYSKISSLMTKNKLLFVSSNDDFLDDQELKEKIKADNLKS